MTYRLRDTSEIAAKRMASNPYSTDTQHILLLYRLRAFKVFIDRVVHCIMIIHFFPLLLLLFLLCSTKRHLILYMPSDTQVQNPTALWLSCTTTQKATKTYDYISMHGRRFGAEFGGTEKNFADQIFKKIYISTPKISDDLFLVIDYVLSAFCLSLLWENWYITLMTLFLTQDLE